MLTTREWAGLILFITFVVMIFVIPATRRAMAPPIKAMVAAALAPRLVAVFAGLVVWSGLWVAVAWSLGLWDLGLLKDTIVVVVALGFPALFRAVGMKSGPKFIRRLVVDTVGLSALVAFYFSLAPFSLGVELTFQILVGSIAIVSAFAAARGNRRAQAVTGLLLIIAFVWSLVWTTVQLITNAPETDWMGTLQSFLLTLWLPALLFPYFYVVAVVVQTGTPLRRFRLYNNGVPISLRVRVAFIIGTRLRISLLSKFNGRYDRVAKATTYREASRHMRDFRADLKRRNQEEKARLGSMKTSAGVQGTDEAGAQLDRREFQETKSRLRYIRHIESAQWERHGARYWGAEQIDYIVAPEKHGLPVDHGFNIEVTPDGQSWRCWRRLPSGWHLAMGATKADGDFYYQGPNPPTTWPSRANGWASELRDAVLPPDWQKNDESRL